MKLALSITCAALAATPTLAQQNATEAGTPVAEVFFAFDSAGVPAGPADLGPIVRWAEEHPTGMVVLDGSTDSVGTEAYNVGLAIRRAEAVRSKLVSLGVSDDRIVRAIYGEAALRRSVPALDRRVTVWTTQEPLHAIVDGTLVRGIAVVWGRPVTYAELHPTRPEVAGR